MTGISPRYIQDKISNALVVHPDEDNIFNRVHGDEGVSSRTGLRHHSLITNEDQLRHYRELLAVVKEEYEDVVKNGRSAARRSRPMKMPSPASSA